MLIIDKYTDYYDHYSNIYGTDKKVVFDRRGSGEVFNMFFFDAVIRADSFTNSASSYFILEAGYKQYLIRFYDIHTKYDTILTTPVVTEYKVDIPKIFDEGKHIFPKELTLVKVKFSYHKLYSMYRGNEARYVERTPITEYEYSDLYYVDLPILKGTCLTKLIPAENIWKDLSMYISAKNNDKDATIINSDKDKIINHGFDTVTSFRNPIK